MNDDVVRRIANLEREVERLRALENNKVDSAKVSKLWESDGGAVALSMDADGAVQEDITQAAGKDIHPAGDAAGIWERLNWYRNTNNYGFRDWTTHFDEAYTGCTWAGGGYAGTPTTSLLHSHYICNGSAAGNTYFFQKTVGATSGICSALFTTRMAIPSTSAHCGIMMDDGTTSNRVALELVPHSSFSQAFMLRRVVVTGGSSVITTYPGFVIPDGHIYLAFSFNTASGTVNAFYSINGGVYPSFAGTMVSGVGWMGGTVRNGFEFNNSPSNSRQVEIDALRVE